MLVIGADNDYQQICVFLNIPLPLRGVCFLFFLHALSYIWRIHCLFALVLGLFFVYSDIESFLGKILLLQIYALGLIIVP